MRARGGWCVGLDRGGSRSVSHGKTELGKPGNTRKLKQSWNMQNWQEFCDQSCNWNSIICQN